MLENIILPEELNASIGSETKEFAVKASRAYPFKKSLFVLIFGTLWLSFSSMFVVLFFGPLFLGNEVNFTVNEVPTVASLDNLEPIIMPAIIIGLFVLVGVGVLIVGIYFLIKKGGYFVGTPSRLIQFDKKSIRSIDWEQFSGDIEVGGNSEKGNITLRMRSGKMVSSKNSHDRYVPDVLYISGIANAFDIEKICRKRIKKNDPTPPKTQT